MRASTDIVSVALSDVGRTDAGAYRAHPWHRNWCAAAVCAWLRAAGIEAPEHPDHAARGAKALGRWLGERHGYRLAPGFTARELELCQPELGDVIVWSRGPAGAWTGHVVLIVAVYPGGAIETVGGNERGRRGYELEPGSMVSGPAVRHRLLAAEEWRRRLYCITRTA